EAATEITGDTTPVVSPDQVETTVEQAETANENNQGTATDPDNIVNNSEDSTTTTTTISIPVKNDQGGYDIVDVVITDDGTNQTATIPGHGDIAIIVDGDGNQNLVLTPEELDGSSNVTCQYSPLSTHKSNCTVKPVVIVKGNTVYTADQAVFAYEEGQDIAQIDIVSNNLLITDVDDQTKITKSETNLGDATISIIAEEEGVGGSTSIIPGLGTNEDDIKNADSLTIVAQSTTLVQTVTNPNDPNDKRVKLEVPAGVQTTLNITQDDQGQLSVESAGQLNGAFKYDSDPFSENKITATSNAAVGYSLSYVESGTQSNGTFVASTLGTGPDGAPASILLTDTTDLGRTNTVNAEGNTSVIINQTFDESSGETVPGDTSFFIGSDKLTAVSTDNGQSPQTLTLVGASVTGVGNQTDETANVKAVADSLTYTDPGSGNGGTNAGLIGNVSAQVIANGDGNIATATADSAFLTNNGLNISADGNINITSVALTNPTKTIDGQLVVRESYGSADHISLNDGDKTTVFGGGITYYQADLKDGSLVQHAGGESGSIADDNYNISFVDGASVLNKYDKDGKLIKTSVQAADVNGSDKDDNKFSIQKTFTSLETIGKTESGVDITEIIHSSEAVKFETSKGDEKNKFSLLGVTGSAIDADTIRYGQVNFNQASLKHGIKGDGTFDGLVTVKNGSILFYTDTSDPSKTIQQGSFSGESAGYNTSDYSIDITAVGKDGTPGNFTLFYLEDGPETIVQVFGEDGKRVKIEGGDKDGNFGEILFYTAEYYENDKFRSFLATEASGNVTIVDNDDKKILTEFNAAKVAAYEAKDGSLSQYLFEDGKLSVVDGETSGDLSASSAFYQSIKNGDTTTDLVDIKNGSASASQFENDKVDITGDITFDHFFGLNTTNPDGSQTLSFQALNTNFNGSQTEDGILLSGQADRINYFQNDDITTGSIEGASVFSLSANGKDEGTTDRVVFEGLDAYGVDTKTVKYGTLDFDKATFTLGDDGKGKLDGRVNILNGSVMFYQNTEDPDHKISEGSAAADSVSAENQDYSINITAIGDDGTPGQFKIYFLENGPEKSIQVFGEDGKLVKLSGSDKDGNFADILVRTVSAYENDEFRQFMVTELQGTATSFKPGADGENVIRGFNIARISGYEQKDGSFSGFTAENASFFQNDFKNNNRIDGSTESVTFTQETYLDTITTNIAAYDSTIDYVEYREGTGNTDVKTEANIQLGSFLAQNIESGDGKNISYVKVNDIKLLAIDYDEMIKVTGDIGEVNAIDSSEVNIVEVKDLENLRVESLDQDLNALFNGKRFLKVDNKDGNGNVTSSYLLVNDASAVINGSKDDLKFKGEFNARVFEYVKDEVTGQSVILDVDADFKVTATQDTPIGDVDAKISGAIKGKNISTSSSSYSKRDGKIKGGSFTIHASSLQKLELKAEVGFLNLLSFKAEGENGKSIHYAYEIDKTQGVLKLRGTYKDGDKLETKFLFFKLKSHKEGSDAVQALQVYLKGQSVQDHLSILQETNSIRQVNEFFGVSDGGAITFTLGAGDKGFALELLVVDERFAFRQHDEYRRFSNPTNSYGLKVKYIKENGDQWGIGATLTADSKINFEGDDLTAFGQKIESVPTTFNANLSYLSGDGELGVIGGLHVPLTSYLVDKNDLDADAQFYDGGRRAANGPGAHVSVTKYYDDSQLSVSGGLYNNFKEPAIMVSYQTSPQVLANLGRGVINIFQGKSFSAGQKKRNRSPSRASSYQFQKIRNERIRDDEIRELEAKRMTVVEEKVDEMIAYYADKKGYLKVKEVLKIAKKYLTSPPDLNDYRKDIFGFTAKDKAHYSFYESDEERLKELDNIILGITENKIMVQIPIEYKNKQSLYDIYVQRRYYTNLDAMDELEKINKSGLDPCQYYNQNHLDN
ncbi:MAG: hypothetical protein HOM21_07045, partial [Halobacteriovoraceae bacterium]|nr:hypothetical protein [Halobacteriovoraceae bacterium]